MPLEEDRRWPLVSIVIPTFNQALHVGEAVASALAQTYRSLEVLVLDDRSADRTADILATFADARLRYVRNDVNLGRVANYRKGLRRARGKWMLNLDGDDYLTDPNFISSAVEVLEGDEHSVMALAKCRTVGAARDWVSSLPRESIISGTTYLKGLPDPRFHIIHMAAVYRRDLAREIDVYRADAISSDWEGLYRLALRGTVHMIDRTVGVWRLHGANASASSEPSILANNLSIWKSIFGDAVETGKMGRLFAYYTRARCYAYFGAADIDRVANGRIYNVFRYLRELSRVSLLALVAVLLNPKALPKAVLKTFM